MPDGAPTESAPRPANAEAGAAKPHAQEHQGSPGERNMAATLRGHVAQHEEPTSILKRLAGRETGTSQAHLLKDAQMQRMREIGVKEGVGELRANISEDPRYQKILEEEGAQGDDSKMRALDKFSAQYPKEAKLYESHSIWHGEDDKPDVRNDLYYNRLYSQAEATQKDRLLAIKAEYSDPTKQLDAMAEEYERVHFESIRDTYIPYNTQFAEKAAIYREAGGQYNTHNVDLNTYAEERLEGLSSLTAEQRAFGKEFHKYIVKQVLGADAPNVPLSQDKLLQMVQGVDIKDKNNIIIELLKQIAKAIGGVVASVVDRRITSEVETSTPEQKAA